MLNISINDIWNRNLMALIRVHLYVTNIYLKHTLCTVERVWMDSRFGWRLLNPNGRAIIERKSSKSYAIIYSFSRGNSDTLRFYVLFGNLFNHVANYNPSWLTVYATCWVCRVCGSRTYSFLRSSSRENGMCEWMRCGSFHKHNGRS